ncbi:MAG: ferritin-like domain-containing protein [Bryobacteraceae bacterium]
MTATGLLAPPLSPYRRWYLHFERNKPAPHEIPWADPYHLTGVERRRVAGSMRQFQLGEWARGRGLLRRAAADPRLRREEWFVPALELFIGEEQRHSEILGRFLDREGIARLERHWIDGVFRRARKLAGLELCVAVLVTAEIAAVAYYQALRDATRSPLLRAICRRILCDESAHLAYQGMTIALLRRGGGAWWRDLRFGLHRVFFLGTMLTLWLGHRQVFRGARWSLRRLAQESGRLFARFEGIVRSGMSEGLSADSIRLDD